MVEHRKWVEVWLAENRRQMIHCPYQPGNLIISKTACFQRYRRGRKQNALRNHRDHLGTAKMRLEFSLCGQCPIGGRFAEVPGEA